MDAATLARNRATRASWDLWLSLTRSRCHLEYVLEGGCLERHLEICTRAARENIARVRREIDGSPPQKILDLGASVGFNSLALAEAFPDATVVGIEPDLEATRVGRAMAAALGHRRVFFFRGVGESLPFPTDSFDLAVCHQVVEHVGDVASCLREIGRVLRAGGSLHLEAPNYLWIKEPHLDIYVPPLCSKRLMKALAFLQGNGKHAGYVDHLNHVHPSQIERLLSRYGFDYVNNMKRKFRALDDRVRIEGVTAAGFSRRRLADIASVLARLRLWKPLSGLLLATGLYPSLLYTARKATVQQT